MDTPNGRHHFADRAMNRRSWSYLSEAAEWIFALANDDPQAGSGPALVRLCEQLLELADGFGRLTYADVEWHDGETKGDWETMRALILEADRIACIFLNLNLLLEDEDGSLMPTDGGASLRVWVWWDGDKLSSDEDAITAELRLNCTLFDPDAGGRANHTIGLRNLPRLWNMLHRLHTNLNGRLLKINRRGRHVGPYGYDDVSVWAHERPRPRIVGPLEPWLTWNGRGVHQAEGDRPLLVTRGDAAEVNWLRLAMAIRGDVRRLVELLWLGYDDDGTAIMIEGRPLGEPAGPEVEDPIGLTLQVADVMEEMWRAEETLHGLRPESIWVERGNLTRLSHRWPLFLEAAQHSCAGTLSPFDGVYSAPEILRAEAGPSPRSDIWLLSALLHTWCSQRYPFEQESALMCIMAIADGRARPFGGPAALADIVSRGLNPDPDARPSLAELVAALQAAGG